MKRILLSICIGSLALTVTAWGAQKRQSHGKAQRAVAVQRATPHSYSRAMIHSNRVNTQRSFSATRLHQHTNNVARLNSSNAVIHRNNVQRAPIHTSQNLSASNARIRGRNHVAVNHGQEINHTNNAAFNRERNLGGNRNLNTNRQRNGTIVNNWRGERFRGQNYAAFRNYRRESHNRGWWRNHCSRIVFVSGGWYYWNLGFWYPAWGYDPYYSYYPFDGPIYCGSADLTPDQVIVDVQLQLQRDGYYYGAVDGILGPDTRRGIAAFQVDHGLAITSAIDEPTLSTLGLS
ncbi:MAG: peptidoglycan-binding protein [Verrucomicrobiota bacterium]|nr:peptidoglycan-binding protein [Verrucomicrobiota bacterium]